MHADSLTRSSEMETELSGGRISPTGVLWDITGVCESGGKLRTSIRNQRPHLVSLQPLAAVEEFQLDQKRHFENLRAELGHEGRRGAGGAAGREEVVDQQHAQ